MTPVIFRPRKLRVTKRKNLVKKFATTLMRLDKRTDFIYKEFKKIEKNREKLLNSNLSFREKSKKLGDLNKQKKTLLKLLDDTSTIQRELEQTFEKIENVEIMEDLKKILKNN